MTGEVAVLTISSVSRVNSRNSQWCGNVEVGPKSVLPDEIRNFGRFPRCFIRLTELALQGPSEARLA